MESRRAGRTPSITSCWICAITTSTARTRYGGHFLAGLDCEPFAFHVYRAGVAGPARGADHAAALRDALAVAVAPHRDAIVASLRSQRHAVLEKSVAHYEAEARRLRAEADKLTRRAARCRDLLSSSPIDATPATCDDADHDHDLDSQDPDAP